MKNENVLYIERSVLENRFDLSKEILDINEVLLNSLPYGFCQRQKAETDAQKKQLIPYVIMQNAQGKILTYRRHGSEQRLASKFSVGIGGHVNDKDNGSTLYEILLAGVCREIKEEVSLDVHALQLKLLGLINEERTDVGYSHTGVVFVLDVDESKMNFDAEIGSPEWIHACELNKNEAEIWASLAITLYGRL